MRGIISLRAVRGALPPVVVTIETSAGPLVAELDGDAAPQTVENFLGYVRAGFYEGTVFHRVIPGFVAQAGGYTKDGKQKAPLRPPVRLEASPLKHVDGALGMARLPEPHTATSEFYFCDGAQPDLDGNYCVFGRLLDGRDTLRRILAGARRSDDWPVDPPVITRAYEGRLAKAAPVAGAAPSGPEEVRAAARKLRGKAALLRSRKPLMAVADLEAAIAQADRTGKREDLSRAEALMAEKEKK